MQKETDSKILRKAALLVLSFAILNCVILAIFWPPAGTKSFINIGVWLVIAIVLALKAHIQHKNEAKIYEQDHSMSDRDQQKGRE